MATGSLAPDPIFQGWADNGDPLAGGLLYTTLTGTSTPSTTWSDAGLTTPNANPVVLNAAGRAIIYMGSDVQKWILKTPAGVTVWTVDPVNPASQVASQATGLETCEGRITLTSGLPITPADVIGAGTVYFTPYQGNRIALYTPSTLGSAGWNTYSFAELSMVLGLGDAGGFNFDVFAYNNAGAVALERNPWTNDTTRADVLVLQDGVLVKSAVIGQGSRRYLGTFRTTAAGLTEDSEAKRFVYNYARRVRRSLLRREATATWTYTTATFRQARATAANKVEIVQGVAEDPITLTVIGAVYATVLNDAEVSIGEDSTTTPSASAVGGTGAAIVGTIANTLVATLTKIPTAGYHSYVWLEASNVSAAGGTVTFVGTGATVTGLSGSIIG